MIVSGEIEIIRQTRWLDPSLSWGLVPTMGYLHEGHLSLVRRARSENDRVAVSIFVNPTQFAPTEDLTSYPRDLKRDLELLQAEDVDLVFIPESDAMYPRNFQTTVRLEKVTKPLEGQARPTHFKGVTTVVAKLFNIVQPTRAYFGQKDAQQSVVIKQMVADLNFNLELIICPTVRETDGLAMSSRNARLTATQRAAAPILYHALSAAASSLNEGQRRGSMLRRKMANMIESEPLARLDYASVADPQTLVELDEVKDGALLSLAVFFGDIRLIDNLLIETV